MPVNGFYNGTGIYRVRFMPDETGEWTFVTASNAPEGLGLKLKLLIRGR